MKKAITGLAAAAAMTLLIGWSLQSESAHSPIIKTKTTPTTKTVPADNAFRTIIKTSAERGINLDEVVLGARCYQCDASRSSGSCSGKNRCRGTKSSCKSRGCYFTGGSSSSCTAANYKYCN